MLTIQVLSSTQTIECTTVYCTVTTTGPRPRLHLDVPGQGEEGVLHVDGGLGRGLHELDAVLYRQLLPPLLGHLQGGLSGLAVRLNTC